MSTKQYRLHALLAGVLTGLCLVSAARAQEATRPQFHVVGGNLQKRADTVLALMGYSAVPDLSASSLSIRDGTTDSPSLALTQVGGGFTLSKRFPLYLEGAIGGSRYDPTFVVSDGEERRKLPTRWTNVSATGGIGWDFPLNADKTLVFRPIFNISLGEAVSDAQAAQFYINQHVDQDIDFLTNGSLSVYGLGGAVMLDYELVREAYEIDVEWRYSYIHLQSFAGSAAASGSSDAQTVNLYARWRAPTGAIVLHKPLRYVLELSHSTYLGSQAGVLGFNHLTSLGAGLELDTSAVTKMFSRVRLVGRYAFGQNISGASLGLALSF
ncbi:hypothetical protein [Caballeronia humi]|uniref:Autotransporter domain-containing protein n=1 Tax=Caballeronia humi TaxID=326474 RepID=A0A158ILA6_9BURK|nr:hypothetical protein [Caballeronia humi]SAL56861.1 hypothetical protein AWB65_04954 [Caballeronia humi]